MNPSVMQFKSNDSSVDRALNASSVSKIAKEFDGSNSRKLLSLTSGYESPGEALTSRCTVEYLADLMRERKQLEIFPRAFKHIEHLVDEEVYRVRKALFNFDFSMDDLDLPEPLGDAVIVKQKVFIPHKQFPECNFVGRILGPRGMTAKQLEEETGCKIMVRGKGSLRDPKKVEENRGKPNWEHLNEELHVLVMCEDTPNRVHTKIDAAVNQINKLLVPAPDDDELKRRQLTELSVVNGTYNGTRAMSGDGVVTPLRSVFPKRRRVQDDSVFISPMVSPIALAGNSFNGASLIQSPNIERNVFNNL